MTKKQDLQNERAIRALRDQAIALDDEVIKRAHSTLPSQQFNLEEKENVKNQLALLDLAFEKLRPLLTHGETKKIRHYIGSVRTTIKDCGWE